MRRRVSPTAMARGGARHGERRYRGLRGCSLAQPRGGFGPLLARLTVLHSGLVLRREESYDLHDQRVGEGAGSHMDGLTVCNYFFLAV
jgi:hypothetical protein